MGQHYLHIGGLVAAGFDKTGRYLLTISHSGRGVFDSENWTRIARDYALVYPERGLGTGIGPIADEQIPIVKMDYVTERFLLRNPDGRWILHCESSGIAVENCER